MPSRLPRLRILLLSLICLAANLPAVSANETLVPLGAGWRFLATGEAAPAGWNQQAFDDAAWMQGAAKIGFGHADHATVLPAPTVTPRMTVYFRRKFTLPDAQSCTGLFARVVCDAGAVFYLNGVEIGRSGMPPGEVTASTPASAEPFQPLEGALVPLPLDAAPLVDGMNTIAVELHASSTFDFDLDFDLELIAARNETPSFVVRGPYLQNGAPTAVTIRWRTDVPTASHAQADTTPAVLDMFVFDATPTTEHEVRLTGLTPDTLYYYAGRTARRWERRSSRQHALPT